MARHTFDQFQLVQGVNDMKHHIAGQVISGAVSTELTLQEENTPDVRVNRESANISQSQFAKLINVNLRTLQK